MVCLCEQKKVICFCRQITEEEIIEAIKNGPDNIEELKKSIGVTDGVCSGKRCLEKVENLIEIYS